MALIRAILARRAWISHKIVQMQWQSKVSTSWTRAVQASQDGKACSSSIYMQVKQVAHRVVAFRQILCTLTTGQFLHSSLADQSTDSYKPKTWWTSAQWIILCCKEDSILTLHGPSVKKRDGGPLHLLGWPIWCSETARAPIVIDCGATY